MRAPLPRLQKKVVYLDQSLLSAAFKRGDVRAVDAVKRVRNAAARQLLVAPFSDVHEDETHLWSGWRGFDSAGLMDFIKQTAVGKSFRPSYEVVEAQISRAFRSWLRGDTNGQLIERVDAVRGDVDEWANYVYVTVNRYYGDTERLAESKTEAVSQLVALFDGWMHSGNTFEQDLKLEIADAARSYVGSFEEFVSRVCSGDINALLYAPVASQCVQTLRYALPDDLDEVEKLRTIVAFFASQSFGLVPKERISACMFAELKSWVKNGAFANREAAVAGLSGVFFDVKHIATFAPYCDAVFVDKQMASLVSRPTVALAERYGTKVFSLNTLDQFFAWLENLDQSSPPGHDVWLERVYGNRE